MTDLPSSVPLLNKHQMRSAFDRAAQNYDEVAVLQREMGERLLERLEIVRLHPRTIVDVGAGTGYFSRRLAQVYTKSSVIALDLATAMLRQARARQSWWQKSFNRQLRYVCADAERLPLADDSVELLFSNATLQWCRDLEQVFAEFYRVLKPGGLLMFTTFGPDTLKELRASWRQVDDRVHVHPFIDMHDIGDILVRARFADPVMDMEYFTLTYPDAYQLMRELKQLGAHNVSYARHTGLTGKAKLRTVVDAYESWRVNGSLPASYEVVYGHAWVAHDKQRNLERFSNQVQVQFPPR